MDRRASREAKNLLVEWTDVIYETTEDGPATGPYKYTAVLFWDRSSREFFYLRASIKGVAFSDIHLPTLLAVANKNEKDGLAIEAGQTGGPELWVDREVAYPKCPNGARTVQSTDGLFVMEARLVTYGDPCFLKEFRDSSSTGCAY